jgi:hypothetical protein
MRFDIQKGQRTPNFGRMYSTIEETDVSAFQTGKTVLAKEE